MNTDSHDTHVTSAGLVGRLSQFLAGGPGFEPGLFESESKVLPLNYPPERTKGPCLA